MKSIYLAILNQGSIRTELVKIIVHLTHHNKYTLTVDYPADKPIANNRNKIVQEFLESGHDYLLMLDGDIVPPNNILNLADLDKDIIGGLCFAMPGDMIIPLVMKKTPKGYVAMSGEGLIECDGIGSGCMMIARRVLEKVKAPFLNQYDNNGIKRLGLDFYFCEQAKKQGFSVYCRTDFPCSHITMADLKQIYNTRYINEN